MIEFKQKHHGILPDTTMVEVWVDGEFRAAIYRNDTGTGIKVVSSHIRGEPVYSDAGGIEQWDFKFTKGEPSIWIARSIAIKKTAFGRWIIISLISPNLAWSGSRWEPHKEGIPTGKVQISNFGTREEAEEYVNENRNTFYSPEVN